MRDRIKDEMYLKQRIEAAGPDGILHTALMKRCYYRFSADTIRPVLARMYTKGIIKVYRSSDSFRPGLTYALYESPAPHRKEALSDIEVKAVLGDGSDNPDNPEHKEVV